MSGMVQMETKVWSIDEFLDQYYSRNTRTNYFAALKQFFMLIYPELRGLKGKALRSRLNELSVRYVQEDRDFRKDLILFRKYLSGKSPNTLNQRITMVKRFLEDNGIEFPRVFLRNLHGKGGEAISDERVPTAEEIRRIVEYMPIHAKTLTLVLASSGMRIGEALQLRVEDVDLKSEPARINIRASYTKTGRKRFTFISTEARDQLEEWLRYRKEFIELSKRRFGAKKRLVDRSDRLFPFSFNNFNQIWANALRKAGLYERDRETGRITLRPHNLRKFFRTHGRWENPDVPEALSVPLTLRLLLPSNFTVSPAAIVSVCPEPTVGVSVTI